MVDTMKHGAVISASERGPTNPGDLYGDGTIIWVDPARVVSIPAIEGFGTAASDISSRVSLDFDALHLYGSITENGDVTLVGGMDVCEEIWSRPRTKTSRFLVRMSYESISSEPHTLISIVYHILRRERRVPFTESVAILAYLRDYWHDRERNEDNVPLAHRTLPGFRAAVKAMFQSKLPPAAVAVMEDWFGKAYHRHTFNIVQSLRTFSSSECDEGSNDVDTRVWDMFLTSCSLQDLSMSLFTPVFVVEEHRTTTKLPSSQSLHSQGSEPLPVAQYFHSVHTASRSSIGRESFVRQTLACQFFVAHTQLRTTDHGNWATPRVSSAFEKIIFLMAMLQMERDLKATPVRPRTRSSSNRTVLIRKESPASAQRLGYAIHVVVKAWDTLARALDVSTAEELLQPYLLYDQRMFKYHVLDSEERGFSPLRELKTLLHGRGAVRKLQHAKSISHRAVHRSVLQDAQMRLCASSFWAHITDITKDRKLFDQTVSSPKQNAFLCAFEAQEDSIETDSGRFTSIPGLQNVERQLTAFRNSELPQSTPEPNEELFGEADTSFAPVPASPSIEQNTDTGVKRKRLDNSNETDVPAKSARTSEPVSAHRRPSDTSTAESLDIESMRLGDPVSIPANLQNMKASCLHTLNCSFRDLLETYERIDIPAKPELVEGAQLVLTDPPYNSRRTAGRENSAYDILRQQEIVDTVATIAKVTRQGGHVLIFTSAALFYNWVYELRKVKTSTNTPMFSVDSQPIFCIRSPTHFTSPPYRFTTSLMNMSELAVHATKLGKGRKGWAMVNYKNAGYIPTRFRAWTNIIDNIPRISPSETVKYFDQTEQKNKVLRPEQKLVGLLQELTGRFSHQGDLVVDLFAGTFSTAVACLNMRHGQYRRFVGCEKYKDCFELSLPRVHTAFLRQVAIGNFAQLSNPSLQQLASSHLPVSEEGTVSKPTSGLPVATRLPPHLVSFLTSMWGIPDQYKQLGDLPVHKWPQSLLGMLSTIDNNLLLSIDAMAHNVYVAPSTIPGAGDGLFARGQIDPGDIVGFYFGSLVYRDLYKSKGKTFGTGPTAFTVERFRSYALQIKDSNVSCLLPSTAGSPIFVVPFEYCVASKINDPNFVDPAEGTERPSRAANVSFSSPVQELLDENTVSNYQVVCVTANVPISAGSELFIEYGNDYFSV